MAENTTAELTIADPPPGYPEEWEHDVALKDGGTVRIRPIAPQDRDALQAMVRGLSRESSYYRFFRVKTQLEPEELERFTRLDYDNDMAFVAIHDGELIGVGRYNSIDGEPGTAEAAFAVADAHHKRGIGTLLLYRITAYARRHDITAFRAYLLADNHVMMRVFRSAGFKMRRDLDEGVYTVEFPTEESTETQTIKMTNEKRAVAASLMPIFYPQSIAVIGASRDATSIGGRLFNNLITADFTGPVYPVNPKSPVVRSVAAYPSLRDVPGSVDLAFIVVPAPLVEAAVLECAEKGVRGVIVVSAGFGETGPEGREMEDRLLDVVRSAGLRMVGPNCMGILNTDPAVSLDGQFGPTFPPRGNVAMSSQSGALGLAILDYAKKLNIGISTFISVGNKADVSGNDLLLFWEDDPATDVILLYLESFGNPRRFARVARRIGRTKPIVAVKSGRTDSGARAASSHTGSLASLDVAVDALFHQTGVIRVDTLEGLFDVTVLLANQPIPEGRRVGIVTNAGGPAILAVDGLESRGLTVPELSPELQERLRSHLSPAAAVHNPIDMIAVAGPEEYRRCLDDLMASDEVDAVMAIFIPAAPVGIEETAAAIRAAGDAHLGEKTFLAVYMASEGAPTELSGARSQIPSFPFPERAVQALDAAVRYGEWRAKPQGRYVELTDTEPERAALAVNVALAGMGDEGGWLDPQVVAEVLAAYGLPVPQEAVVTTEDEAVAAADAIAGPVVVKVISLEAVHKSDVGGVVLDVEGEDDVRSAFRQVTGAVSDPDGVLVQEFIAGGHEVLIGMVEDPNFGPLIVFGLGGIFVELIGDVAFRIHPLTDIEASEIIRDVKSAKLLDGYRGAEPGDIPAVEDVLLRVSSMIEDLPEILEMDLNPVKVKRPGEGVRVVDARIKVRPVQSSFDRTRTAFPSAL